MAPQTLSPLVTREQALNLVIEGMNGIRDGILAYHDLGLTLTDLYADLLAAGWAKSKRTLQRVAADLRSEGLLPETTQGRRTDLEREQRCDRDVTSHEPVAAPLEFDRLDELELTLSALQSELEELKTPAAGWWAATTTHEPLMAGTVLKQIGMHHREESTEARMQLLQEFAAGLGLEVEAAHDPRREESLAEADALMTQGLTHLLEARDGVLVAIEAGQYEGDELAKAEATVAEIEGILNDPMSVLSPEDLAEAQALSDRYDEIEARREAVTARAREQLSPEAFDALIEQRAS